MLEAILANAWIESLPADTTTMLAAHINYTMARSTEAREAYFRIYGVEWSAIGNGAEVDGTFGDLASGSAVTVNLR